MRVFKYAVIGEAGDDVEVGVKDFLAAILPTVKNKIIAGSTEDGALCQSNFLTNGNQVSKGCFVRFGRVGAVDFWYYQRMAVVGWLDIKKG